jgi:(1->4)-alpha-D-glucan 1-alpha-D-glucosylmutase
MIIPSATYRLQFNQDFNFKDAAEVIPYLAALGISHVYASPIFKARPGSTHGYDIVDPLQVNGDCGGYDNLQRLRAEVEKQGMFWLQDIVPNHMAFDSENTMLMDVLEQGERSPYFHFFDIDWHHIYESMKGRLLAPFLGKFYAECLENGEIALQYADANLSIKYYNLRFPCSIESYAEVFEHNLNSLEQRLSGQQSDFIKFLGALQLLKTLTSSQTIDNFTSQIIHAKKMIWQQYLDNSIIKQFIDENIIFYNGNTKEAESLNELDRLISKQLFRLSFWKVAAEEINYRRFFTVNDLISIRVEDETVFEHTHDLIFRLIAEGLVNGIRIDHIDGLYDPLTYLRRVRNKAEDSYLVVEKILATNETLPANWPVQGTTGYDFLNIANGIFCHRDNNAAMSAVYKRFIGRNFDYEDILCDRKRLIIGKYMAGNIDNLAQLIKKISYRDRHGRDITLYGLRRALVEVMAHFPVYRTYLSNELCSDTDQTYIRDAIQKAKTKTPGLIYELSFIEEFLLLQYDRSLPEEEKREWVQFAMHFQQYTGPLMAKAAEDTFLYIYNRLISLNEVGSNPQLFGCSIKEFHDFHEQKLRTFPFSMNATSTHDTKRGEDVRARINVLSELPKEWETHIKLWSKLNRTKKKKINNQYVPDANDEYLLYQTLIGAYPFDGRHAHFIERIKEYLIKAVREAKVHTAWIKPDTVYEEACSAFVENILTPSSENQFLKEFSTFQEKIAFYGIFNSLSQTLLKITCPGVPDIYKGSELWDLNLVDPDNRRPVDFKKRQSLLQNLIQKAQTNILDLISELLATKEDGRIKLFLIYCALKTRNEAIDVFQKGEYLPLIAEGKHKHCVIAFARSYDQKWSITVVPRFFTTLVQPGVYPLGEQVWQGTGILLPDNLPEFWQDAITGQQISSGGNLQLGSILKHFPVALLIQRKNHEKWRQ